MKNKLRICLLVSLILIIVGGAIGLTSGFNLGTDFKGGVVARMFMPSDFETDDIREIAQAQGATVDAVVKEKQNRYYSVAIHIEHPQDDDVEGLVEKITQAVNAKYEGVLFNRYSVLGQTMGKKDLLPYLLAAAICIVVAFIYLTIRQTKANGLTFLIIMAHDLLLFMALVALTSLRINASFVGVVLAVVAYSAFNAISLEAQSHAALKDITNQGNLEAAKQNVQEAGTRRVLVTSVILVMVLATMMLLGSFALKQMAILMLVGVVVSCYSSMMITLPLNWKFYKKAKKKA